MPRNRRTSRALPISRTAAEAGKKKTDVRALAILAIAALAILVLDQGTKYLVLTNLDLGENVPLLGDFLRLHLIKNSGAAFSLGEGLTWIFSIIAAAVTVFIVVFARRIRSVAWAVLFGILLGGNLGNLGDRLLREPSFGQGHVIDFLQLYGFPAVFNVADSAIVASMGLFLLLSLLGIGLDGKRHVSAKPDATAAASGGLEAPAAESASTDAPQ